MSTLVKVVGDNWIKLVGAIFAAGVIWARIPSSSDLDKINNNLIKILTEQRERIDQHDVAIAARLTQEDVERMIRGPLNPWLSAAGSVVPALAECKEQIREVRKDVADLWKLQGNRRSIGK